MTIVSAAQSFTTCSSSVCLKYFLFKFSLVKILVSSGYLMFNCSLKHLIASSCYLGGYQDHSKQKTESTRIAEVQEVISEALAV